MRRVAVIDDRALERHGPWAALRAAAGWEVTFALRGAEALVHVVTSAPSAVVLGARRGDDTVSLLERLRRVAPNVLRVVVCDEGLSADEEAPLGVLASQVLRQPLSAAQLHDLVERHCAVSERLSSPRVRTVVNQLGALPPLPRTTASLSEATADPECSLDAVAQLVERDPAIALSVLKLTNSAFFGLPRGVATVREAVRLLGIQPLRNVVLTVEVFEGVAAGATARALQSAALARAAAARELLAGTALAEPAFTAGILADVGTLLIATRLPIDMKAIETALAPGSRDPIEVETERLGVSHAEIGAALLAQWNLPQVLVQAVVDHHRFEQAAAPSLSGALALVTALEEHARARPPRSTALVAEIERLGEAFEPEAVTRALSRLALAAA